MQRVAQDWLVLQLTANSGAALGITTGLQFLPFLLLAPVLRPGRRPDAQAAAAPAHQPRHGRARPPILGLLAVTGTAQIWHVYVLAFVLGIASAFDAPARQSFVSEIVDPDDLTNAVGLNSASFNAARLVGPAVAGLLIAAFGGGVVGTGWVILINAVSYVAPGPGAARHGRQPPRPPALTGIRGPGAIREGFAYVRARPDLLLILAIVFSAGTFGLNFQMTQRPDGHRGLRQGRRRVRPARHLPRGRVAHRGAAGRRVAARAATTGDRRRAGLRRRS